MDTQGDPANCGACNNVCAAPNNGSATCTNGKCGFACIPGFVQSGNQCVSSGGAGAGLPCTGGCAAANATTDCDHRTGMCFIVACSPGFADCDGKVANGCEVNLNTDASNCGGCGRACPAAPANGTAVCTNGVCGFVCIAGFSKCNGACKALTTDVANCGSCGHVCPTPQGTSATCNNGTCGSVCLPGKTRRGNSGLCCSVCGLFGGCFIS